MKRKKGVTSENQKSGIKTLNEGLAFRLLYVCCDAAIEFIKSITWGGLWLRWNAWLLDKTVSYFIARALVRLSGWEAKWLPAPNSYISEVEEDNKQVKWLKIDKQDETRRRRQRSQVAIYYISKQVLLLRRAKNAAVVALHSLQSSGTSNKKPYQNMQRKPQSTKDLDSCKHSSLQ